jgi:uncharacterized protein (TIGR03437 family)
VLVTVVALFAFQLGSQSVAVGVSITSVPTWGQDGQITGKVFGTGVQNMNLFLFAFVPDVGLTGLPGDCLIAPVQNGQFSVDAAPQVILRNATRFMAYLVPSTAWFSCDGNPLVQLSWVQRNAAVSASLPRLPQYSTLSFAGMQWLVKEAPVPVYPGPQVFVKDNAFVDSFGQLHLRISRCGNSWCAAEIYTKEAVGYGTYRFDINSQLSALDPNVTLGLFTWDALASDQNYREWDIEFSRWGNAGSSTNAQYVVQPYGGANNMVRFAMTQSAPSTHNVSWFPSQVSFASATANGNIRNWTFTGGATSVPTPGDAHLHLNFYVGAGKAPFATATQEIVISGLQYTPSGPQIGFPRTVDTISYDGRSYVVPLSANSSSCVATVESDAPWLTVAGSNTLPPGVPLQYTVSDNVTQPRSGKLILQSSNCSATLGAQVLVVNQNSLTCAPTFTTPSTHLGFLQSRFTVGVKGTSAACTWNVSSNSSWLRVVPGVGAGDGTVQVSSDANGDAKLRGTVLSMNNGAIHSIYQDGAGAYFALSPAVGSSCSGQTASFGLSWLAAGPVEIRLNSATGTVVGQYPARGTTALPALSDGTLLFLLDSGGNILASARASVGTNCNVANIAPLGVVNAASYGAHSLAPGSLAALFGSGLSSGTAQAAGSSYPTTLGGASVTLAGVPCPLWYVSPGQINFAVPVGIPPGRYTITTGSAASEVLIADVSPGIFTLKGDGTGVPLTAMTAVLSDGSTLPLSAYQCSAAGCAATAIDLPANVTDLYLILYGTGIRYHTTISATIGGAPAPVEYVGAQSQFPGLDQVNLHLRGQIHLSGSQALSLKVDGIESNTVQILFR